MLSKITEKEFDQYIDFAYGLATDLSKSGYPTYADQIKTKEDFVRIARKGLQSENDEILLFRRNGSVEGWIHYFREPADHYLQTCVFNIQNGTEAAVEEFLAYIEERFPEDHAYLGFPQENRVAAETLLRHGFICNEQSFNNSFFFDAYSALPQEGDVRPVTKENFQDFRSLHAFYEEEMYWDSDHILADLPNWQVYVCYKQAQDPLVSRKQLPAGAIYFRSGGPMAEIYGLDYPEDVFDEAAYRALLIRALNEVKRSGAKYMTYFSDEKHLPLALELGFHCVGKYLCFDRGCRAVHE